MWQYCRRNERRNFRGQCPPSGSLFDIQLFLQLGKTDLGSVCNVHIRRPYRLPLYVDDQPKSVRRR